jgi:hypothetical protein
MPFDYQATPGNTDWFVHERFGMFIHCGGCAVAGRGLLTAAVLCATALNVVRLLRRPAASGSLRPFAKLPPVAQDSSLRLLAVRPTGSDGVEALSSRNVSAL